MDHAVLRVTVGRRPCPPGLLGEHGEPAQIRVQAQVSDRPAGIAAGRDGVVDKERVEDGRCADPPRRSRGKPAEWHGLHARHAAVVDPRGGDTNDPLLVQLVNQTLRRSGLLLSLLLLHNRS
jgi:hypothetical protein